MDPVVARTIPLYLAMFAVIGANNAPLYVHSYTGEADELRYHHLAHASLDIFEEREADPERAAENYVGLMFSMDDLVLYGYRTTTGLRIVVGLALIDGRIKDIDVVTICRAVHQAFIRAASNPFFALPDSRDAEKGPLGVSYHQLQGSRRMAAEASKLGKLLDGGRGGA